MMQFIRDHAQGVIVWTILGLIIITFALWGIGNYFQGASKVVVASVNGKDIGENEFLGALRQQQQRLQLALGKNYDPNMFNAQAMKRQVLDNLINRTVQNQFLQDARFAAGSQLVDQEILSIKAFQDKGQYSAARVERYLRSEGITPEQFRANIAHDIMAQQLYAGIADTSFVTGQELDRLTRLLLQRRDIGLLTVAAKPYEAGVKVDDKEITAYYDAHKSQYMTPEQVSIDYLEVSQAQVATKIKISDADLRTYYQSHQGSFVKAPEQRRVRQILIKVDKPADEAKARQEAETLYEALKGGASFEKLARERSQDTLTAKKGGELGYIAKGEMGKKIDAAVFALNKGQISQPVRTQFGYQIFQVQDIKPRQIESFAQAKGKIEHTLQMQQAEDPFYKVADRLTNLVYENPDSLEPAAQTLDLKVQHSGLFSRKGAKTGIASNHKVVEAAFSDQVLNAGQNSDPIDLGSNSYVVIRVAQHKSATQQTLAQVRDEIIQTLRQQAARARANAAAEAAAKQVRQGVAPTKVASTVLGAKWVRVGNIERQADGATGGRVPATARAAAFRLPRPQGSGGSAKSTDRPTAKAVALSDGDSAVVVLFGISEDKQGDTKTAVAQLRDALARELGSDDFNQLIRFERSQADVKIHQAILKAASEE